MGRYFYYRMHPFSIAELCTDQLIGQEIRSPICPSNEMLQNLWKFGGFPEPLQRGEESFLRHWQRLRKDQLFYEDLRDLSRIHDIRLVEVLAEIVSRQVGQLTTYTSLAKKVSITIPTVKQWLSTLRSLYYLFDVRPWTKNISRSLIKEPKYYMWDWSLIDDDGMRFENLIACHLLKATNFWTDRGFGTFDLYYLRDKDKREVDFLVSKDKKPWFIVECKLSNSNEVSKNLAYYQKETGAPHAFQVVWDMDYVDQDCFSTVRPTIVPAATFLSQLV
jgi:predicted AAA+ superfamily ATPase